MLQPDTQPIPGLNTPQVTDADRSRELFDYYHGAKNALEDLITKGYHSSETMSDDVKIYCELYLPQLGTPGGILKDRIREVADNFFISPEELRISVQRVKRHILKKETTSKRFRNRFGSLVEDMNQFSSEYQRLNPVH
jgi:hypothetical protein